AAVAITAARTGAWWGLGSALAAVGAMSLAGAFTAQEILVRALGMLANSGLVIWLGSMLRRGAAENQAYQEGIADAVPDFVWSCGPDGKPTYVNTRTLAFFGVYLDEFERDGWKRFAHPDDTNGFGKNFPPKTCGAEYFDFESRYRRRDGSWFWFASRAVPILNERGEILKWVGTSTNIDARKRVELERELLLQRESHARNEAERASRMKDEFLATVSHELRTPLNAIVGWVYLLQDGKITPAELDEGLAAIERNTRVQTRLIEDLLDMSRIISGQIRLDLQNVDLALVIDAAIESVRPSIESKHILLNKVIDPKAAHVRGDAARLQQVVWNLLTNAAKFTPKDGRVEIAVSKSDVRVEILVSDSGEGISPAFLPHIFERFRQADASTTRRHSGLGLGLAIVKQLVELHGGSVEARSPGEGRGATFRVVLPIPAAPGAAAENIHPISAIPAAKTSQENTRLRGVQLLVVDDEPDAREIARRILTGQGAEVTACESAEQALTRLRAGKHFHVLISDVGMPGMDGYDLIKTIRDSSLPDCHIPAIALTAFTRTEDRQAMLQAGFDMFIPKPVDPSELIAAVERCAARAIRELAAPRTISA
ncbi:MAG TPA: ATP-binding protein, partial [Chthoniobacteraceae bacterium]|nr:ATP-binding protein [Chthoniobacteraceae bacterium]